VTKVALASRTTGPISVEDIVKVPACASRNCNGIGAHSSPDPVASGPDVPHALATLKAMQHHVIASTDREVARRSDKLTSW
jgi:hypothetical protein